MSDRQRQFESCRETIWEAISGHVGTDGNWDGEKLVISEPPFTVTLDVYAESAGRASTVMTRLRGAYINRDGFCFGVKRRSWMSDLAGYFGRGGIEIGDEEFDHEFVIQANSSEEIRQLLAGDPITRKLLMGCKPVQRLEVRDHEGWFGPEFPEDVDELYLEAEGRITDLEAIADIYQIFAGALTRLCILGSAYEGDPKVDL